MSMEPIPQEWIRDYVDQIIKAARLFGDTQMGQSAALRADAIMDMVKAFRDRDKGDAQ